MSLSLCGGLGWSVRRKDEKGDEKGERGRKERTGRGGFSAMFSEKKGEKLKLGWENLCESGELVEGALRMKCCLDC